MLSKVIYNNTPSDTMHNSDGLHKQVRDTASKQVTCAQGFACFTQWESVPRPRHLLRPSLIKETWELKLFTTQPSFCLGTDKVNFTLQRTMPWGVLKCSDCNSALFHLLCSVHVYVQSTCGKKWLLPSVTFRDQIRMCSS